MNKSRVRIISINSVIALAVVGVVWWGWSALHPAPAKVSAQAAIVSVGDVQSTVSASGTYAKGAHIWDPRESMIAIGARSATVWGPDGGLADALATALVVAGPDGASWFAQSELRAYSAYVIDRHDETAWTVSGADFSQ